VGKNIYHKSGQIDLFPSLFCTAFLLHYNTHEIFTIFYGNSPEIIPFLRLLLIYSFVIPFFLFIFCHFLISHLTGYISSHSFT